MKGEHKSDVEMTSEETRSNEPVAFKQAHEAFRVPRKKGHEGFRFFLVDSTGNLRPTDNF